MTRGQRTRAPLAEHVASGFFHLRTPLLPFADLAALGGGGDRAAARARLAAIVERPDVREAVFLASPGLEASIATWRRDPDGDDGRKIERALIRYVARMAARPTPFGLFAGGVVGTIAEGPTRLELAARSAYRRYTRLDNDYLAALIDALVADPAIAAELRFRPNSSLYRHGDRLRYAERAEGRGRSYALVAADATEYLTATLERATTGGGARPDELARALVDGDADGDITREDADAFVAELIATQLLVPELAVAVTGGEPIDAAIAVLERIAAPRAAGAAAALHRVRDQLAALDAAPLGTVEPARYRAIAEPLAALGAEVELSRLFQVDLVKTGAPTLAPEVVTAIAAAIELAARLTRSLPGTSDLERFRDRMTERYEGAEVALVDALDEESGIGFGADRLGAEITPLLDGLVFGGGGEPTTPWHSGWAHLGHRVGAAVAAGEREVVLDDDDVRAIGAAEPARLPDAFAATVKLAIARRDDGTDDVVVGLVSAGGPSGAPLLGRFCHADPGLHARVVEHLRAEEALRPDAVFAEIVHLPDGRIGNIIARPVLRGHEIAFLGTSGAPPDHQIAVTDLTVAVEDGRIVLRSRRLGREVVPRLTNAHNFHARSLAIYRFLCALQRGVGVGFHDGPGIAALPFVPRVRTDRVVLATARWRLTRRELAPIHAARDPAAVVAAMQAVRTARALPRWIVLADGDNALPVDLDCALSIDSFAHLIKRRGAVTVHELWPPPETSPVVGPEGRFTHELVVPFVRAAPVATTARAPAPASASAPAVTRRLAPGGEWLYAKLYGGRATADHVIRTVIAPVVAGRPRWFFLRYDDPEPHLRVRIHGDPRELMTTVLPALHAAAAPLLTEGSLWRVQLDTYVREIERYGGAAAIERIEDVFAADSIAVAEVIEHLVGETAHDLRWQLALLGVDRLLADLGLDLPARRQAVIDLRDMHAGQQRVAGDVRFERALGARFRRDRAVIEAAIAGGADGDDRFAPARAAFAARSRAIAPIATELRALAARGALARTVEAIAGDLVHMHVNRIVHAASREQELVLCDLLRRVYDGQIARSRS